MYMGSSKDALAAAVVEANKAVSKDCCLGVVVGVVVAVDLC